MPDGVRVGIVGSGRIGRVHAEAYRRVAGGSVVACLDAVPSVADELARDFGLEVITGYSEMLAREDIDAVLIATPNWLHAEMTCEALATGKHVFCQKPMALTIDEADRVVQVAKASAAVLQFGFMLRFTPPFPEIKRVVDSAAIGEVIA